MKFPILPLSLLLAAGALSAQAPSEPQADPATEAAVAALFRDPVFQQRFAESYLAETEIEPKVSEDERDTLIEVSELLAKPVEQGGPQAEAAITLLQGAISRTSTAVFDFTLANLLAQRERMPEAIPVYQRAVEKAPKFRRAWNNLGLAQVRTGDFRGAARALARVVELGGGNAYTYGLLGIAHLKNEDYLAAESAYRLAVLVDPLTVDWRMGLASTFLKQRRFAEASTLFGALIAQNPDRADLWLFQANALVGMNEPRKAAENLELVDRLGKSTVDSMFMLGDIYINEELVDVAAAAYERGIKKDEKGTPERAVRAAKALAARSAHAESARVLAAIEAGYGARLDTVAKKDVLKLRARLAVASGAGDEEAAVLQQIVALDPLDGEALILLGQYHGRKGEPEQAVMQYERAAGIAGFEAEAKVSHAKLLVGQGKYQEALPLLKQAQQKKPRDHIQQFLDQVERIAQNK